MKCTDNVYELDHIIKFPTDGIYDIVKIDYVQLIICGPRVYNDMDTILSITGQYPQLIYARKSIAGFKIREGEPMGVKITLRGNAIPLIINQLFNIVLPNSVSRNSFKINNKINPFDSNSNTYTIGVSLNDNTTAQFTFVLESKSGNRGSFYLSSLILPHQVT
jgi:hypothetical protein